MTIPSNKITYFLNMNVITNPIIKKRASDDIKSNTDNGKNDKSGSDY